MRLIRRWPLGIAFVVLVSAALVGALAVGRSTAALTAQTLVASVESVTAYADGVETYLRIATESLEAGARSVAANDPPLESLDEDVESLAHLRAHARALTSEGSTFARAMVLRGDGRIVLLEPRNLVADTRAIDYLHAAWFQETSATGSRVVSDLVISPVTQAPTVVIAVPLVNAAGDRLGTYAGALRLDVLSSLGAVGDDDRAGNVVLTDSRGLVVADQHRRAFVEYQTDLSSVPAVAAALDGDAGSGRWRNVVDGVTRLGAWTPVAGRWAAVFGVEEATALAPARVLRNGIAAMALVVSAVVGLVAAARARRMIRPIEALVRATGRLRRGERSVSVPPATGELGELSQHFNEMAAELERKEAELRARAAELQRANADLESFTYTVSHDLRAPVRALVGFTQLVLDEEGERLSDEGRRRLGVVSWSAHQLSELVDDLLRLSRFGRQALERRSVDVGSVVSQVLQGLDPDGVSITVDALPQAFADASLLKHVYSNLISNAVKYTRGCEPAEVRIGYRDGGERAYFVRDTGVGFDMRYAGKLFAIFERLHGREYEGTGVGLAIVKQIVERHDGHVWAESEPGRGSTFWFTIGGRSDG